MANNGELIPLDWVPPGAGGQGNTPAGMMGELEARSRTGEFSRPPDELHFGSPSMSGRVDPGSVMSAEGELARVKRGYTPEMQDELVGRMGEMGASLRDDARTAEQQAGNYPYQFMNLAMENPRGNLNNASFGQTLRFSRLADMLNNRLRYVPSPQVTLGTPQTGFQAAGGATLEKYPEIETQEMRQMRANERMDERARQAGIDLQSRIQAYPQDLQEQRDKAMLGLEGEILSSENELHRAWQKLVQEVEYAGSVEMYFKKMFEKFLVDLKLNTNDRVAQYLYNLAPTYATLWANLYGMQGEVPTKMLRVLNQFIDDIWDMPAPMETRNAMYIKTMNSLGLSQSAIEWLTMNNLLSPKALKFMMPGLGGGQGGTGSNGGSSGSSYGMGPEARADMARQSQDRPW